MTSNGIKITALLGATIVLGAFGCSGSVAANGTAAAGTTSPSPIPDPSASPTGSGATPTAGAATPTPAASPTGVVATPNPVSTATMPPAASARVRLPAGFSAVVVANVNDARELAMLPNGDMLIGTGGSSIYLLPDADAATSGGAAAKFITLSDGLATGVGYGPNGAVYASTENTIWKISYNTGDRSESNAIAIAHVRTGSVAPNSDGDVHHTTSVAVSKTKVYAGVGSSCNSCIETDATRASVQSMNLDGSSMTRLAENARNPIALAIDPVSQNLWIGGAGQDSLTYGHPYEYFDSPTLHGTSNVNYGWPACEENHHLYNPQNQSPAPNCSQTVAPLIEFPAYSTLIGATFYPANQAGAYAFPAQYRGGLFITSHGSWHCCPSTPPHVWFVPMNGGAPAIAVNWNDPTVQGQSFVSGYGTSAGSNYASRPTGIAVGKSGSLFVADDGSGDIIRIRHNSFAWQLPQESLHSKPTTKS